MFIGLKVFLFGQENQYRKFKIKILKRKQVQDVHKPEYYATNIFYIIGKSGRQQKIVFRVKVLNWSGAYKSSLEI